VQYRPASESAYGALLANVNAAYRNLKNASEDCANALADVPGVPPHDPGISRIARASRAYEDAREEWLLAVAKLNDFMISELISSRSTIPRGSPPPLKWRR
jgi:hypothetical protein